MSVLPPTSTPRAALRDLRAFLRQRGREQVWAAAMSLLITAIIVIIFFVDAHVNTTPAPTIVYVEDYRADRTDDQIKADQQRDAAKKAELKEAKKAQFKKLEKAFHIE